MLTAFYALFLPLGFSLLGRPYFAEAGQVNVTIDDTDPSIIYEPLAAWFFGGNTSECAGCLTPPSPSIAYNKTWHHGLHIPPTPSVNGTNSAGGRRRSEGASAESTLKRRNDLSDERRAAPDSSHDLPVSLQLNFTGSAIYLYCILPLGTPPNADSPPTLMNLTFTLDSGPAGSFLHRGSTTNRGFQPKVSVFSRGGLSDSTHSLLVNLGPNSVLLFDSYVVTRTECSDSDSCPTHSQAPSTDAHKLNVIAIAGAVGGSIAVIVIFVACLEFCFFRPRRSISRRQMQDRDRQVETQSIHSDISGNPSLLPRYFPRAPSNAPPPYVGPPGGSSVTTQSDLSSIDMFHQTPLPSQSTYPSTGAILPVFMHDMDPSDLPPPFSVVSISSPPVHTSAIPRMAQENSPREHTEDTQPASLEVAPKLPTAAIVLSSRPTQTMRRSRSSSLPDIDSATVSPFPSTTEAQPLSARY